MCFYIFLLIIKIKTIIANIKKNMLYISRDKQYFIKDKSTNSVVEFNIYNMITRDYLQTVLVLTNNYNQL